MKILFIHGLATFHTDTPISDIYDFPNPLPIGLHKKIPQTPRGAEGFEFVFGNFGPAPSTVVVAQGGKPIGEAFNI